MKNINVAFKRAQENKSREREAGNKRQGRQNGLTCCRPNATVCWGPNEASGRDALPRGDPDWVLDFIFRASSMWLPVARGSRGKEGWKFQREQ